MLDWRADSLHPSRARREGAAQGAIVSGLPCTTKAVVELVNADAPARAVMSGGRVRVDEGPALWALVPGVVGDSGRERSISPLRVKVQAAQRAYAHRSDTADERGVDEIAAGTAAICNGHAQISRPGTGRSQRLRGHSCRGHRDGTLAAVA